MKHDYGDLTRSTKAKWNQETFAAYDAAEYLTNMDAAAAYLEVAIEENGNNAAAIAAALGAIARSGNMGEA